MDACPEGCIDVELALAFVDGRLGARRVEIEQRIDACARCRAIVAEAARGDDDVRDHAPTIAREASTVSERRAKRRAAPERLESGTRIGRYVIERPIGAGGMGVVWLARDPELRRAVVIKLVRVDAFPDESREALELRMRREAQAMAQLSHANVVQIFDLGEHGDRVFLAMEYIPGQTLDAWLVERERTRDEILAMFGQAGAGLAAAHRAGLVHRDFKPANVLVSSDGIAKVTDFGLARGLQGPALPPVPQTSGVHAVVTRADAIVGTPAYMAPEQAAGLAADARSDQYAFALALLDALANQSPTARAELDVALTTASPTPRQRVAIARALAADPAERFVDMTPLLAAIAPPGKRRVWPLALGAALCAAAVILWFVTRPEPIAQCVAEAPQAWPAAARTRLVEAFTAAQPPFGAWTGASITGALDRAVERLAIDEVAACNGHPPQQDCLAQRSLALAAAIRMTPTDDPWALIAAIDRCDPPAPTPAIARMRSELATTQGLADDALATKLLDAGEVRLAARAFELGARVAGGRGDFALANRHLLAQLDAGERANDDAIRARASLALLDVARWSGDFAAAELAANRLRSLQSRQRRDPRADFAIAAAEGTVFGELGDARRAMAAWERAVAVAPTASERSHARVQRAVQHRRQYDPATAQAELLAAIAEAPDDASSAEAYGALGDLALAAGDGAAARSAYAKVPSAELSLRLRVLRARALAGDVDGALAELDAFTGDATERIHVGLAKTRVLRHAGRIDEAHAIIKVLARDVHSKYLFHTTQHAFDLSMLDRLEVILELCTVDTELRNPVSCDSDLAKSLHETAPIRLRLLEQRLRDIRAHEREYLLIAELERYAKLLDAIRAPPELAAGHRWELARHPATLARRRREFALAARTGFVAAGKTAELAEIDELLGTP